MTVPDDARPVPMPAQGEAELAQDRGRRGVIGNERLTALAGAALLVLIVVELATTASNIPGKKRRVRGDQGRR